MRLIKYLLFITCLTLFVGCNTEEESDLLQTGYLTVSGMELECDGEVIPLTKAISVNLKVGIWRNEEALPGHVYEPGSMPGKIALSPGTYKLKAFTPNYGVEPGEREKGEAVYFGEIPFEIQADNVSSVKLSVPMINTGVSVDISDQFMQAFTDFTILLEAGGRSYTINPANSKDVFYFMPSVDETLNYSISVVNKDGESNGAIKSIPVLPGKLYSIRLEF